MSDTELETDEEAEEATELVPWPQPEPGDLTPEEAAEQEGSHEIASKLQKATGNYHKRIEAILGHSMEDAVCPTCDGFGFADAEQKARAASELPGDFVHPANYVTCDGCNGYGEIVSGSKNPAHQIVICTKCNSLGYRIEAPHVEQATVYTMPPS